MTRNPRSAQFSLLLISLAMIGLPLNLGCPGSGLEPVTPTGTLDDASASGNLDPIFEFTEPSIDVSAEVGQVIHIAWAANDSDDNAAITLLADPDNVFGNGNERVILPLVMEDSGVESFDLDTSSLTPDTYRIIARVNDGVNPELIAVATGRILLLGQGLTQGNTSPTITMTQPEINLALSQDEGTTLAYCGRDKDDGPPDVIPDVIVLLDTDEDPTNDVNLSGAGGEAELLEACGAGGFPRVVNGVLVLGCAKDDDCQGLAAATNFPLTIDVAQIPPRIGGEPYWPRVTMWDHINPPVHSYSRGNISVTSLGSGIIDLGQIGRTISGSKFYGFEAGDWAGSNGVGIGDIDGDGVDDFVIVSRYGSGLPDTGTTMDLTTPVTKVGSAAVIMGRSGEKYGSEIPLNSIGTLYPGSTFIMPESSGTQGLVSIARVGDIDYDNLPEILFGAPYVERFYDNLDDDPCNCACDTPDCYEGMGDLLPNPLSRDCVEPDPDLGSDDHRESLMCSNDLDLSTDTPLNGGYAILVSSRNDLASRANFYGGQQAPNVFSLRDAGQSLRGAPTAFGLHAEGARFRGPWYDQFDWSQTVYPSSIIPDTLFGQTVNSMPTMAESALDIPAMYGPALLLSAPNGYRGHGAVTFIPRDDFTRAAPDAQSFPYYVPIICNCGTAISRGLSYPGLDPTIGMAGNRTIIGKAVGDRLGYAASAGDFNRDGSQDILMGAPGAERNGVAQCGIVYIIFGHPSFPLELDLATRNPPRMEIHGVNQGDQFGSVQTLVGDLDGDSIPDVGFASQYVDGPGGKDSGAVYVILGGRKLTGENIFNVNQVGTSQLPGFRIYGSQPGGHAGAIISNAGDFNGDGTDDMLISSADEFREVNGQPRRGVAYLVFGGPHLPGKTFNLSQVGTSVLPGVVFISPYAQGSADEATIDSVAAVGDVNNDGFADVLLGVSQADFVNPLEPNQRRVDSGEAYLIYGNNTGSNRMD